MNAAGEAVGIMPPMGIIGVLVEAGASCGGIMGDAAVAERGGRMPGSMLVGATVAGNITGGA